MEKRIKLIFTVAAIMFLNGMLLFADTIDSSTLIEEAKKYDNSQVLYEGEVIGDIMTRGAYTWINVNDGVNAIGVWLPASEAVKIIYAGSYKYQGDIVRITGEFHRTCALHGGDLDIHADKLEIIKTGFKNDKPLDVSKAIWAAVFSGAALCMVLYTKQEKIW